MNMAAKQRPDWADYTDNFHKREAEEAARLWEELGTERFLCRKVIERVGEAGDGREAEALASQNPDLLRTQRFLIKCAASKNKALSVSAIYFLGILSVPEVMEVYAESYRTSRNWENEWPAEFDARYWAAVRQVNEAMA